MPHTTVNVNWNKIRAYCLYWAIYLLIFTLIQGLTDHDYFRVLRNELFSLLPKALFVWIVVENLSALVLIKRRFARFIAIYLGLIVVFAFLLRLVDNYIIIHYFLTGWKQEPLLSVAPFLYNIIKLQFLVTTPFCLKLYGHFSMEYAPAKNLQTESDNILMTASNDKAFLYFKCERRMVKLPFTEISYFEAQGNYLMIYTANKTYKTYLSISELEEKLPPAMFTRVHRSFIVAVDKIESYNSNLMVIAGKNIPIGRSYGLKVRGSLG